MTTLKLYYSNGCHHCKTFHPIWNETCNKLDSINVKHEEIDINKVETSVDGVPTIILSKNGKDIEYTGPRETESILKFIKLQNGGIYKGKIYKLTK